MRAALSAFGRCVARALRKSAPLLRRTSTRGVPQNALDRPMGSWSESSRPRLAPGNRELKPTGDLFPSLCFPPSVSLYGFSHERNRPPPRLGVFLGFPRGLSEEGGP